MRCLLLFLYIGCHLGLNSQTLYGECHNAFFIDDPTNWCSSELNFNVDNTPIGSNQGCLTSGYNEVWISFIALAPGLLVEVVDSSGTVFQLQFLEGDCYELIELDCSTMPLAGGQTRLLKDNLVSGRHYFIRIGATVFTDNASICLINFFPPAHNANDFKNAWVLCSKDPFVVNKLDGFGEEQELIGASCFSAVPPSSPERNSSWLRWTCDEPGILTFVLEPLLWNDDLDFVVYRMGDDPQGSDMEQIRCMATGVISSNCSAYSSCCGPTGLKVGETDVSESYGCGLTANNFLQPLVMATGESYVLVVNNYTSRNQGYKISFGGDATFLGMDANFSFETPGEFCQDQSIVFNNTSQGNDDHTISYKWFFGPNGTPSFSNLDDEVEVKFDKPGIKSVVMEVTNGSGCRISHIDTLHVPCCSAAYHMNIGEDLEVLAGSNVSLEVVHNLPGSINFYQWEPADWFDCDHCQKVNSISLNESGVVVVSIADDLGCELSDSIYLRMVELHVYIPNIFTPNHDGINDFFSIYGNRYIEEIVSLRIFNRWGACVFDAKGLSQVADNNGWDGTFKGKDAPDGVYVYLAVVKLTDGTEKLYKGSVSLIR